MNLRPILVGDSRPFNATPVTAAAGDPGLIVRRGSSAQREPLFGDQLFDEECREALSIARQSTHKSVVKEKRRDRLLE